MIKGEHPPVGFPILMATMAGSGHNQNLELKLHPCLPLRVWGPKCLTHLPPFSQTLLGSWIGSGAPQSQIGAQKRILTSQAEVYELILYSLSILMFLSCSLFCVKWAKPSTFKVITDKWQLGPVLFPSVILSSCFVTPLFLHKEM